MQRLSNQNVKKMNMTKYLDGGERKCGGGGGGGGGVGDDGGGGGGGGSSGEFDDRYKNVCQILTIIATMNVHVV
jgi:hypothetical protein